MKARIYHARFRRILPVEDPVDFAAAFFASALFVLAVTGFLTAPAPAVLEAGRFLAPVALSSLASLLPLSLRPVRVPGLDAVARDWPGPGVRRPLVAADAGAPLLPALALKGAWVFFVPGTLVDLALSTRLESMFDAAVRVCPTGLTGEAGLELSVFVGEAPRW